VSWRRESKGECVFFATARSVPSDLENPMRRPHGSWPLALALVLHVFTVGHARAQATAQVASGAAATNAAKGDPKKVLTLADYGRWNRITQTGISPDGKWMTYAYQPNDGDVTLYVKEIDGSKLYTIAAGAPPQAGGGGGGGGFGGGGANNPIFSDDSRWVGYYVNPPGRTGRARPGGPAGAPGGRSGAPANPDAATPAQGGQGQRGSAATRRFELLDLVTGDKFSVPNPASFQFSSGGKWLAVRANKATPSDTTHDGTDLILRELSTGATRNVGNASAFAFDDAGKLFAYTIDATDRLGNGIYLIDLASGQTRTLAGAALDFDGLTWSDKGTSLAVLRGDKAKTNRQKDNVLLVWTDPASPNAKPVEYDPTKDASFPKGMVVSEFSIPRWSNDGARVVVGLKEQEAEPPRSDEPQANVDVWHWKDPDPQSVQMVRIQQERRFTYPASFSVATRKLTRLADSDMRAVQTTPNGKWGVGRLDTPYRLEVSWGGSKADQYRINTATGERTLIEKGVTRTMGISPDSRWFLYLKDKHVKAYNLETGKIQDLDDGEKISWLDAEDDHPYEIPTYGVAGWSKDGRSVLLNHRYDIWQLPLDGSKAVNLTQGAGEAGKIRFRLVRFDRPRSGRGGGGGGGIFGAPTQDDEGVDLTKPLILSAYGDWTKKSGYYQVAQGKAPAPLIYADKQIGGADKATKADRVIFTEQTFTEFPDYWASTTSFASPRKMTDANPQLAEYAWGSKVLIDYTNSKGQKLQGTLTLPANYEPGKKYPMLVYFYELMSNTHHQFSLPVYDDRPHMSTYASNGYLVLQPDVVYEIGKPGSSALDCVTSAVKKVIESGYADAKHIGLQGHSWGGYQSSFIVTQTDLFAAVVTGAPPTNLVSFYDELYKSTGTVQQGIMELGQVRMGVNVTPWNAHELYESQSPIHHVTNIKTPFLILQGTADGAVDWVQGLEFFNAARRNGKEVIFLSYPDEPHHLAKKENQKDFQIRMKQFFDHYLIGTPAPKWMTDGVPQVKKGAPIE
jgi:dipeptidyl aminopeptidase/acylaminoacyl peptidase